MKKSSDRFQFQKFPNIPTVHFHEIFAPFSAKTEEKDPVKVIKWENFDSKVFEKRRYDSYVALESKQTFLWQLEPLFFLPMILSLSKFLPKTHELPKNTETQTNHIRATTTNWIFLMKMPFVIPSLYSFDVDVRLEIEMDEENTWEHIDMREKEERYIEAVHEWGAECSYYLSTKVTKNVRRNTR